MNMTRPKGRSSIATMCPIDNTGSTPIDQMGARVSPFKKTRTETTVKMKKQQQQQQRQQQTRTRLTIIIIMGGNKLAN
ncbi:hypothetical protein BLOT_011432 [Blomia tropicalis]|nr:hypothetical protein BLOT_011432 [Blomia tropicalis]